MSEDSVSLGVLIAVLVVLALVFARLQREERSECEARGGHIVSKGSTGVGVSSGGRAVTTYSDVRLCVSADGRILE